MNVVLLVCAVITAVCAGATLTIALGARRPVRTALPLLAGVQLLVALGLFVLLVIGGVA